MVKKKSSFENENLKNVTTSTYSATYNSSMLHTTWYSPQSRLHSVACLLHIPWSIYVVTHCFFNTDSHSLLPTSRTDTWLPSCSSRAQKTQLRQILFGFHTILCWPATYDYYFLAAFDSLLIILLLLVMDSSSSPCYYYFRLATSGILGRFIKTWQLKESFSHQRHQRFHPFGKRAPTPSVSRSPLFLSFLFASPSSPPPLPHILSPVCLNSHPFSTFFLHCSNAVTPRHRTSFPLHPMPCGPEP